MKTILSNIIFGIVICVFGYLAIANILHVIYLNKYDTFNGQEMTNIKSNISELESNIAKISKLDNTVLTKEELKSIKDTFDESLKSIKANKLLSYEGEQKLYLKDFFRFDLDNQLSTGGHISMLNTLAKYDDSINNYIEVYKYDFINNAYNVEATIEEVRKSYKYNTLDILNAYMIEQNNIRIPARVYSLSYYVVKENYLAKLVLEIGGGINE